MPIVEIRLNEMQYLTKSHLPCNWQNLHSSPELSNQRTTLNSFHVIRPCATCCRHKNKCSQDPNFKEIRLGQGPYEYKERQHGGISVNIMRFAPNLSFLHY